MMEAFVTCKDLAETGVDCEADAKAMWIENGGSERKWTSKVKGLCTFAEKYKGKTLVKKPMTRVENDLTIIGATLKEINEARPKIKAVIKAMQTDGCSVEKLVAAPAAENADKSVNLEFYVDLVSDACTEKLETFFQEFDYTTAVKNSVATTRRRLLEEIEVEAAAAIAVETVEVAEDGTIVPVDTGVEIYTDPDDGTFNADNGVARTLGHPVACMLVVAALLA